MIGLFSDSPIPCNIFNIPICLQKLEIDQENWLRFYYNQIIMQTGSLKLEKQFNTAVLVLSIWYKTALGIKQMPTH